MDEELKNILLDKFATYVDTHRIDVTDLRDLIVEFQRYTSEPLKELVGQHADGKFAQTSVKYQSVEAIKSSLAYLSQSNERENTKYLVMDIVNELKAHTDKLIAIYSSVENSQTTEQQEIKTRINEYAEINGNLIFPTNQLRTILEENFHESYKALEDSGIRDDVILVYNPEILKHPRAIIIPDTGEDLAVWIEEAIANIL